MYTLVGEKDNVLRVMVEVMFYVQAKLSREDFLEEVTAEWNSERQVAVSLVICQVGLEGGEQFRG